MNAEFKQMSQSTKEDWEIIGGETLTALAGLPDRVLNHLRLLDGDQGGFPIDRLQHSLQTAGTHERLIEFLQPTPQASRAWRGAVREYVYRLQ